MSRYTSRVDAASSSSSGGSICQSGLTRHRDANDFTFNIALSHPARYGGGGTHFDVLSSDDGGSRSGSGVGGGKLPVVEGTLVCGGGGPQLAVHPAKATTAPAIPRSQAFPEQLPSAHSTAILEQGEVLMHPGGLVHSGVPITWGKRYILVGFVCKCPAVS